MKNRKVYVTTFCGVAVAMNIVLGIITSAIGIPLYLDTLGTVVRIVGVFWIIKVFEGLSN